ARPSPSSAPSQSQSAAPTAPAAAAPGAVEVTADSLIGRPLDLVRERLMLLGLAVRVQRHFSRQETGTVLAVEPTGKVRRASTIRGTGAFRPAQRGRHAQRHPRWDGGGGTPQPAGTMSNNARRSG